MLLPAYGAAMGEAMAASSVEEREETLVSINSIKYVKLAKC